MAALFCDAVADSPNWAKEFVFHGNLSAHQFERRANDRCGKSSPAANAANLIDNRRIRDVSAIPSQKEVHCVNGCNRDVHSVRRGLPRNQSAPENHFRQILRRTGHFQNRDIVESRFACLGSSLIPSPTFQKDQTRHEQPIPMAALIPPLPSRLLLAGGNNVTAGACGQKARNRRFEINLGLHEQSAFGRETLASPKEGLCRAIRRPATDNRDTRQSPKSLPPRRIPHQSASVRVPRRYGSCLWKPASPAASLFWPPGRSRLPAEALARMQRDGYLV